MRKYARLLIEILIVLVLLGVGLSAIIFAYHQGYSSGYQNGQHDGYGAGSKFGYTSGYSQGNNDGYSKGHTDGYSQGKNDGYSAGYSANTNSGYGQGQTDQLGQILDWETNSCTQYSNGYYQIKFWRAYDGTTKYNCLVQP